MRYGDAERAGAMRRGIALLFAAAAWACSGLVFLAALAWGLGLRCDESCGGSGWRHTPDAWQWNALVVLGATAFVAGGGLVYFVWQGRRLFAAASVAVGLCAVLVLASAFSPEWPLHFDRRSPGELLPALVGVAAPLAAVLFARPPRRDEAG